jgi:Putative transposase
VHRERARDDGVEGGRSGGVVVIQRFGSALNLNVYFHALVLDGVFAEDEGGSLAFHERRGLRSLDVAEVLAIVDPLVSRQLRRRGLAGGDDASDTDAWTEEAPVAAERLQRTADDQVVVSWRRPWRDGTTAIVLSPMALIERLAVLVPRPRVNLLSYHGVLGARSAWRAEITGLALTLRLRLGRGAAPAGLRPRRARPPT